MPSVYRQSKFLIKRCLPTRADVVWLVVIAMLCNAALPMASAGEPNKVLMCTSSGYQWLDVGDTTLKITDRQHCVQCISSDQDDYANVVTQGSQFLRGIHSVSTMFVESVFASTLIQAPRVRGPPIIL